MAKLQKQEYCRSMIIYINGYRYLIQILIQTGNYTPVTFLIKPAFLIIWAPVSVYGMILSFSNT